MSFTEKQEERKRYYTQITRVNRYREPLIQACIDLHHHLEMVFFQDAGGLETEKDKLELLYAFAQLFGWIEIVRRELLEFNFNDQIINKNIIDAMADLYNAFEDGRYSSDSAFHQTNMEMRAMGELMCSDDKMECIRYTVFIERMKNATFKEWFRNLKRSLTSLELSMSHFDPGIQEGIRKGSMHAWEEKIEHPGVCVRCSLGKASSAHRNDISAHFYRLWRVYRAVMKLAISLDFENKHLHTHSNQITSKRGGVCERLGRWIVGGQVSDAPQPLNGVIIDRFRRDLLTNRPTVTRDSGRRSGDSAPKTPADYPVAYLRIDLIVKLMSDGHIVAEKKISTLTNRVVSEFRAHLISSFSENINDLGWQPDEVALKCILWSLEDDVELSQYGLRTGSILYLYKRDSVVGFGNINSPRAAHGSRVQSRHISEAVGQRNSRSTCEFASADHSNHDEQRRSRSPSHASSSASSSKSSSRESSGALEDALEDRIMGPHVIDIDENIVEL
jgi:hypothetical protein